MVLAGDICVASYNPDTGARLWLIDGPTEQFVASLVYSERCGLLFITGGFPDHHILAIRPDGTGNVTQTHIAWRTTRGVAYVPSLIIEGDYLLLNADPASPTASPPRPGTSSGTSASARSTPRSSPPKAESTFSPTKASPTS